MSMVSLTPGVCTDPTVTCATGSSLLTGPEGLSLKERDNLRKLKALRRYRRRYGVEALLHRQLRDRRQAITEGAPQVCLLLEL